MSKQPGKPTPKVKQAKLGVPEPKVETPNQTVMPVGTPVAPACDPTPVVLGAGSEVDYYQAWDLVQPGLERVLQSLKADLEARGIAVSEPQMDNADEYKLWMLANKKGRKVYFDFTLLDSPESGGNGDGFNVDLQVSTEAKDLARFCPYNYSEEVWTKDPAELERRVALGAEQKGEFLAAVVGYLVPEASNAQDGPKVDLTKDEAYQKLLRAIKPPLVEGLANVLAGFGEDAMRENRSKEIEHKSRDGFIPFTDGGWLVEASYYPSIWEGEGHPAMHPKASAGLASLERSRDAMALSLLQGDKKDWAAVKAFLGKGKAYQPKTFDEVMGAIMEQDSTRSDYVGETLRDRLEGYYLQEQNYDEDDRFDVSMRALVFAPDNDRNEVGGGNWEIRLFGRLGWGSYSLMTNQPKQNHVDDLEIQISVDPNTVAEATIRAQVEAGTAKTLRWLLGVEKPDAEIDLGLGGGDLHMATWALPGQIAFRLAWDKGKRFCDIFDETPGLQYGQSLVLFEQGSVEALRAGLVKHLEGLDKTHQHQPDDRDWRLLRVMKGSLLAKVLPSLEAMEAADAQLEEAAKADLAASPEPPKKAKGQSPEKVGNLPKDTLWSTINTPAIQKRIERAAATRFPREQRSTFFEHDHWWLRVLGKGEEDVRTYDVVDAEGGRSVGGFDFEEV